MKKQTLYFAIALAAACGESADNAGHDNHDHNNENHGPNNETATPEEDACEHMADGPEEPLTAVAAGETPPSFSETHHRYDITIPDGAGVVAIEIAEDTEMHFFFDSDVTLTVTDASDTAVAAEEEIASVDACSEVAEGAAYDLFVGTYTLLIETTEEMVSMVPVTSEHAHEE